MSALRPSLLVLLIAEVACPCAGQTYDLLSVFTPRPDFLEQESTVRDSSGIRITVVAPLPLGRSPVHLIIYALPNGNTIEQTKGKRVGKGVDWHFGIQHIAAQTRLLRTVDTGSTIVVAYAEAPELSWPLFRSSRHHADSAIVRLVTSVRHAVAGEESEVTLSGHSGGGSFVFGFLRGVAVIPAWIRRVTFLDSNYGYSAEAGDAARFLAWLRGDTRRYLTVLAYDDRSVTLNGRPVVSASGGTFRRTHELVSDLGRELAFQESRTEGFWRCRALDGRVDILVHLNPGNEILHTVLVGPMNGFLHAMTSGTPLEGQRWTLGGPPAYEEWIDEGP